MNSPSLNIIPKYSNALVVLSAKADKDKKLNSNVTLGASNTKLIDIQLESLGIKFADKGLRL